jgi:ribosome maturation factor RimP
MNIAHDDVKAKVRSFVESAFAETYEVFDVTLKPVQGRLVLEVTIDAPGGIHVHDCETVSRALDAFLDEQDLIHRQFTLEVSSPGAERFLKRQVDFERHVGRLVRWVLLATPEGPKQAFQGRLLEFTPTRIVVQGEKGLREFPLDRVETAQAVLEFPPRLKRG